MEINDGMSEVNCTDDIEDTNDCEVRHYLKLIKGLVDSGEFEPKVFILVVELPTGALEIITNVSEIASKIDYALEAYDDQMVLKSNDKISVKNMLIV